MDANHLVEITSRKFLLKISNNSCDRKRQCSTGHNNLEKLSISLYLNQGCLCQECDHKFWYPRKQFHFRGVKDPGPTPIEYYQDKYVIKL